MRTAHLAIVAFVVFAVAAPARAQFRNQGLQLPNVGWLGLGSVDWLVQGGKSPDQRLTTPGGQPEAGWNLLDQPTLGLGYFLAIGYDLWLENQASIGAMTTVKDLGTERTPVLTLAVSTGLRYNLLSERIRPFLGAHIQYLWLIGLPAEGAAAPVPVNNFLGGQPMFIGLRPSGGVEWIFGDEMGVQAEVGVLGMLVPDTKRGLGNLFLPAALARFSYNVYF